MDWNAVVAAAPDQVSNAVGDEVAILSLTRGTYFGLNATGARVWGLLQSPIRVRDLCDQLLEAYDVDADVCRTDLINLLEELARAGLIHVQPGEPG
jgi:hypothetical protein